MSERLRREIAQRQATETPRSSEASQPPKTDVFTRAYTELLTAHYQRLHRGGYDSRQSTELILDEIVRVSNDLKSTSNHITSSLLFLSDRTGDSAHVYASSKVLRSLHAQTRLAIQRRLVAEASTENSLFTFVQANKEVCYIEAGEGQSAALTLFKLGPSYRVVPGSPGPTSKLLEALNILDQRTGHRGGHLLIPISSPALDATSESLRPLLLASVSRTPDQVEASRHAVPSTHELEQIQLALLPLSDVGVVEDLRQQREIARVQGATRRVMELFIHSFGDCASRLNDVVKALQDGRPGSSMIDDLVSIRKDLNNIKKRVLAPLSDMGFAGRSDLRTVLQQAIKGAEEAMNRANASLRAPDVKEGIQIGVDPEVLEKILENILENASRACSLGQRENCTVTVEVDAARHSDYVYVYIIDNGCGLPAKKSDRDKVARTEGFSGWGTTKSTGVGLFSSRVFLRLCDGYLGVHPSQRPGMSTEVRLKLRRVD